MEFLRIKEDGESRVGLPYTSAAVSFPRVRQKLLAASNIDREESRRFLSFHEAHDLLLPHGIDLEARREEEVRSAVRWGLVRKADAAVYGEKLFAMREPERDIQLVLRELEAGAQYRILLGVDSLAPDEAFQKLIVEAGIRHFVRRGFSKYQRVDAQTRQPLQNQRPTGKAGILFTPNHLNLPADMRNISPDDQLARMVNGKKYVGPVGWMILFRKSVDRALPILYPRAAANLDSLRPQQYKALLQKALLDPRIDAYLPDVKTVTQFPDLRDKVNGAVPSLYFDPHADYRKVVLGYSHPDDPYDFLGGRDALGTLLS